MCELLEWLIFSLYVLNGFFYFFSEFYWGFVFLISLSMLALLYSADIFSALQKNSLRLISNKMCSYCLTDQATETQWLVYTSKYGYRFPWNPDLFSHKMKNVNRHSHQWNIGIKIRSITIVFNKSRAGSKLFEKHRWRFIFFIIKGLGPFQFF